jgi:PAS domain-containing protein
MSGHIGNHDWAATPLGPLASWPQTLRTITDLMLATPQPVYIAWGLQLTSLYNDAYSPILGTKHPDALGVPFASLFAEVWNEYRPIVAAVMAGEAQNFIDKPVALAGRPGVPMNWFTFSWTPLRDEAGAVAGFYCTALETTEKVRAGEASRAAQEAALRQSEAGFRALVNASTDAVYCMGVD